MNQLDMNDEGWPSFDAKAVAISDAANAYFQGAAAVVNYDWDEVSIKRALEAFSLSGRDQSHYCFDGYFTTIVDSPAKLLWEYLTHFLGEGIDDEAELLAEKKKFADIFIRLGYARAEDFAD